MGPGPTFADRRDAGRRLAAALLRRSVPASPPALRSDAGKVADRDGPVVLGLPRGGVVVAAEVALAFGAPLDVLVVRKLGHPARPELGLGAVAEDGTLVLNDPLLARLAVGPGDLAEVTRQERVEMGRRVHRYRQGRAPRPLAGREVVVVDDGVATGYTVRAAVAVARARGARRVLLAVPVAVPSALAELAAYLDELVWLRAPRRLRAVGQLYREFPDVSDAEVLEALHRADPDP